MTFETYQARCERTAIYRDSIKEYLSPLPLTDNERAGISRALAIQYCALGLGEVGEVQGKIKKIIRDTNGVVLESTRSLIASELGDCLWYISQLASELNLNLKDIAETNLQKLADRMSAGTIKGSGDER